ncbi:hypothetical protein EST38_g13392 [Candolleomyces aberdarensis]|uniref:DUF6589 domain-containing protein n=1 Tax=Candolleomyces aberdarensis TaxID=2316362 RepID=A0A4Q2D2C4_9AGAR|nr:hypothetical protein EST38_g13392 [Candolleomyces aberdarensis]
MQDNMLVNVSGLPGRWMGMDLNIEHLIRYMKALFASKGIYSNWERLGNISAGIHWLHQLKKQVTTSVKSGYYSSTHKNVDTSPLVFRIANKVSELHLQHYSPKHTSNPKNQPVPDLQAAGYKKFASSSLDIFNQKVMAWKEGIASEEFSKEPEGLMEEDTIGENQILAIDPEDLPENQHDGSALHDDD